MVMAFDLLCNCSQMAAGSRESSESQNELDTQNDFFFHILVPGLRWLGQLARHHHFHMASLGFTALASRVCVCWKGIFYH